MKINPIKLDRNLNQSQTRLSLFFAIAILLVSLATPATAGDAVTSECSGTPIIERVSPDSGSTAGGDEVVIAGACFEKGATVSFDLENTVEVTSFDSSRLTVLTPSHPEGVVSVYVTNPEQKPVGIDKSYSFIDSKFKSVLYNANGGIGSLLDEKSPYEPGTTVQVLRPEKIEREGYTFATWNTQSNGKGEEYLPEKTFEIKESTTLYAMWELNAPPPTSHLVTFFGNSNTGGSMAPQSASSPSTLTSNAFTRTGFTFGTWNTAANNGGVTYINGTTYDFNADLNLYANWIANTYFTVTFDGRGGTGTMVPQSANATTPITSNVFSLTGYTFSGWNTAANGSGVAFANGANYPFTSSNTLFAQWTLIPPSSHVVTFDSNWANGGTTQQVESAPTPLATNTFIRSGYIFVNWNTASDLTGVTYSNGQIFSFASDVRLYARWTIVPIHTLTFSANGGSGSMNNQTSNVPAVISSNTFTRSGFEFHSWRAAPDAGAEYHPGDTYSFNSDSTLYASWSAVMILPPPPPDSTPTGGLVTAIFIPAIHTVTFLGNGASIGAMTSQSSDTPTVLNRIAFARTGFNFDHWSSSPIADGSIFHDEDIFPFHEDMTLYAHWTVRQTRQVAFSSNGSSITSVKFQSSINPAPLLVNTLIRSGYVFLGWNTASDGSGTTFTDGSIYPFTFDANLFAQWAVVPFQSATISLVNPLVLPLLANQSLNLHLTISNTDGSVTPATVQVPQGLVGLDSTIRITPVATNDSVLLGLVTLQVEVLDEFGAIIPQMLAPLTMQLTNNLGDYIVAQSNDGFIWTPLPQLTGTTLDGSQTAGYYYDADGFIVVVTSHLTQFGLHVRQVSPLQISTSVKGVPLVSVSLKHSGGNGSGSIRFATTTPKICSVSEIGVVTKKSFGICKINAIKGGDAIYLNSNTAILSINFNQLGIALTKVIKK